MIRSYWLLGILIVSIAFNVAAIGSLAYTRVTQPQPGAMGGCGGMTGPDGPHLTSAQVQGVEAVRAQFAERARPIQAAYEAKNAELARLALSGGPNGPGQIDRLSREIAELHRQIQLLAVDNLRQESALLDPGQREAYCGVLEGRICPAAAAASASGGGCMGTPQ